ncbi:hypothetical protein [Jannaschia seohaensis]|uniref:Invasion protein IalB, involved in pathogenesis n=1 Tax=Jannaschia seohaensis TaxID=475081 RepID=A0A2Y9B4L6_9RHOB|nr:hypothetical protein [Jannaschia seohaensis]PWJ15088.1 hypothetical protein BCF38_111105 [Jannaschia seohaensis]SSA49937.1 hypothetical protein SAMN05421539_111105 [Jannaschia seohaensis]
MIRLALILAFLSAPAAAQDLRGECRDGSLWWATDGAAGLGPCESPEEGFFRLTCTAGTTTMRVLSPYPIAVDQRGTADLTIDGRRWRLEGIGADDPQTGQRVLVDIEMPSEVLQVLAAGAQARLDMPTETRLFHLVGSGAAIAALRESCE